MCGYALTCCLAFAIYLGFNRGISGDWLKSGYDVWSEQRGRIMGFGRMMWSRDHTPQRGLAQTVTAHGSA